MQISKIKKYFFILLEATLGQKRSANSLALHLIWQGFRENGRAPEKIFFLPFSGFQYSPLDSNRRPEI
jgi:hypothetical protein